LPVAESALIFIQSLHEPPPSESADAIGAVTVAPSNVTPVVAAANVNLILPPRAVAQRSETVDLA